MSSSPADTWERLPVLDEYDEGGRRALYVGDHVVVVSELAAAILDRLPADETVVADHLVASFGSPPGQEPRTLVRSALADLAALGLVVNRSSTER